MSQERNRILDLLATGKITTEEAARLLDALDARRRRRPPFKRHNDGRPGWDRETVRLPKFMYVKVVSTKGDNVNVKILSVWCGRVSS